MTMRQLTRLRHGPLRRIPIVWAILRAIYRLLIRFTPGLTVSKRIGPYGPFKLDRRFAFSNFEAWGSAHNRGFKACVDSAKDMNCVLDIGAHIGLVSLPLSRSISANGRVFAFEPASVNAEFLKKHIESNQINNIEISSDLLGESDQESIEFFESDADSGMNTTASSGSDRGYKSTRKRQITLDSFCIDKNLKPELIKIDTEGAEVGILKGATETLRRHRPTIFLSVHPRYIIELGSSTEELESILEDLDYVLTDMDGNAARPTELTEYIAKPR